MRSAEKLELLKMIADSMGCTFNYYTDVDDAIAKGISISRMVDTASYITDKELFMLNQKRYIK